MSGSSSLPPSASTKGTSPEAGALEVDAVRAPALAERWLKVVRAIDGSLRASYLRSEIATHDATLVAHALERICIQAEQAEAAAHEVMVTVVDVLEAPESAERTEYLREEAAGRGLVALGRLLRRPLVGDSTAPPAEEREIIPDYGHGRVLTLGERKALARRPTRAAMDKLLRDPHPDVVRTLLGNPKLTESDVIRMAAARPASPAVLGEIARSPRWTHRPRVRMAIVLNPDSPAELSMPLLSLLVRPELETVASSPSLSSMLRAAAHDRLARRPPVSTRPPPARTIH